MRLIFIFFLCIINFVINLKDTVLDILYIPSSVWKLEFINRMTLGT